MRKRWAGFRRTSARIRFYNLLFDANAYIIVTTDEVNNRCAFTILNR